MKRIPISILLALSVLLNVQSADLIRVFPVTSRVIVLVFDDGYIEKHGYHESNGADEAFLWPLDLERASNDLSYLVTSIDDPAYADGKHPVSLGRKSKAHDVSKNCIRWNEEPWAGAACKNDYASYHYIYLELPEMLVNGKTYTIHLRNLADHLDAYTFTYDIRHTRAISIHTNHFGYATDAEKKYAYISQWMGTLGPLSDDGLIGKRFDLLLLDASGNPGASAFNGTVQKQKAYNVNDFNQNNQTPYNNFVVSDVYECDFSSFSGEGEYILAVEGVGASYPFRIHPDVYREPFYWVMKGIYLERALMEAPAEYGLKWAHPAWESANFVYTSVRSLDLTDESGNNQKTSIFNNFDWDVDLSGIRGWYHDAGDWDGYISHFRVPRTLMQTYELAPDNFSDGELDIPEAQVAFNGYTGTHIPDILDEAVWLVDYFKNNVGPTGGIFGSRISPDISTTSGINPDNYPQFVFRDECRIEGIPSWEDCCTWIVHGEDPRDSYAFASVAAQYAWNLELAETRTGEDYSAIIAEYADSAFSAYDWAINHTLAGDASKSQFIENRAAAAAWLYKLTGEQGYLDQLKADLSAKNITASTTNPGESKWAVWAYAMIDGSDPRYTGTFDATLQNDLRQVVKKYANLRVTDAIDASRSMRWGGDMWQPVWNGQATTPWILPAMVASVTCELAADPDAQKYLDACYTTNDYFLGGNQLNMVWMTYAGHEHTRQVMHLDSEYNPGQPGYIPGIPVYGPRPRCDWFAPGQPHPFAGDNCYYNNSHDADFALMDGRLYPEYYDDQENLVWPVHELYFENYGCPPTNEFTVHQTMAPAAGAYGFVTASGGSSESNREPEITLTSASTACTAGEDIVLSIDAADPDGWIYRIHIYRDKRLVTILEGDVNEYILKAAPGSAGTYRAMAEDNLGLYAASNGLEITVSDAENMPSVEITTPETGGLYRVNDQITIGAEAGGQNIKVEFFYFNEKIGEDDSAPFMAQWTPPFTGSADITAVATDDRGLTAVSLKTVTVTEDCLNMVSPQQDAEFQLGDPVVAKALPEGCSGDISSMRFYIDGTGFVDDDEPSATDGSYEGTFGDLNEGSYTVYARTETTTGSLISDSIRFSVVDPGTGAVHRSLSKLKVFPNPANDMVFFEFELSGNTPRVELRIIDVTGRTMQVFGGNGNSRRFTWEAGSAVPGIYSYTIVAGNEVRIGKLVIGW